MIFSVLYELDMCKITTYIWDMKDCSFTVIWRFTVYKIQGKYNICEMQIKAVNYAEKVVQL